MTASVPPAPPAPFASHAPAALGEPAPVYATWLRRLVAVLLDLSLISMTVWVVAGDLAFLPPAPVWGNNTGEVPWPEIWSAPWWALAALYLGFVGLQAYAGVTPGKAAVGIRVISERTGRPAGAITTVVRWFAHLIDAILFIGYLRPLWHPRRQTFADSLVGTVVVRAAPRRGWRVAAATVTAVTASLSLVSGGGASTETETTASCTASDGTAVSVTYEREESWGMRGFIRRDRPVVWSANIEVSELRRDAQRLDVGGAGRTWTQGLIDGNVQPGSGSMPEVTTIGPSDGAGASFGMWIRDLDLDARTQPLRFDVLDADGTMRPLCTVTPDAPPVGG